MSASVAPRFDPARRRAVTIALLLVTALASFESTVVSTAMPTIIGELHGLPLYSWVFSIYLLASTITMPIYGRLADVYGRRRILMRATAVFLAGAVTCALARSMPQLIVARGLQGLGAGGLIPIALTVSGDLYSLEERARVQALFSGVWGFASLVGPLLGAFLTVTFGWRSIFTINVPLGLVAFVLVATKMIESRKPGSDPLDVAGAVTLALGIAALLFAVLQRAGAGALGTGARLFLGVLGVALLGLFARLQAGGSILSFRRSSSGTRETAAPYVGGVLLGTTIYGVDTFVPLFVQGARGGTAGAAGGGHHAARPLLGAFGGGRGAGHRPVRLPDDGPGGRPSDPRGLHQPARRGTARRARFRDQRGVRPDRRGPRTVVALAGARDPERRRRGPPGRRDEPRAVLSHRRGLAGRGRPRRDSRDRA